MELVKGAAEKSRIVWLGSELLSADRRDYRPREQGADVIRSCKSKEPTACTCFLLLHLLRYGVEDSESGVHSWQKQSFLSFTVSTKVLGPTQPPFQWIPENPSPRKSGRSAKLTTCLHLMFMHVFMVWYLIKHRDNFSFTFTL
jgi:hypothetical protein